MPSLSNQPTPIKESSKPQLSISVAFPTTARLPTPEERVHALKICGSVPRSQVSTIDWLQNKNFILRFATYNLLVEEHCHHIFRNSTEPKEAFHEAYERMTVYRKLLGQPTMFSLDERMVQYLQDVDYYIAEAKTDSLNDVNRRLIFSEDMSLLISQTLAYSCTYTELYTNPNDLRAAHIFSRALIRARKMLKDIEPSYALFKPSEEIYEEVVRGFRESDPLDPFLGDKVKWIPTRVLPDDPAVETSKIVQFRIDASDPAGHYTMVMEDEEKAKMRVSIEGMRSIMEEHEGRFLYVELTYEDFVDIAIS